MSFFYADGIALEMDNPTLFDTGSEEVGYRSLWEGNAFDIAIEAALAVTPALSLSLQGAYCAFRREVSPPPIYVIYTSSTDNYRILSASDLVLGQVLVMGRFSLPFNQLATEPENLWKWREPADPGGFIPFITLGAGIALFDACTVSVQRREGTNTSSLEKDLFDRTVNLAVAAGIGLEYRFSFLSIEARFDGAHNGRPASAWPPYTGAAQPLLTYRLALSARILF